MSAERERLAIDGGLPAVPNGPPAWPLPDERVRAALEAAYADGSWGKYHGPANGRLSERLAELVQLPHVTLCASGTIAVELALRGLAVGPGDEVILAAYDFPGNFRAIEAVGALPVLVDIDPETWCLDAGQLAEAVSPATRAILVSHLHGGLAAMRRICEFAQRHGLAVVEDACQSPGARVEGRPAGSWGDVGVLSFGGSKLLTAGRGGAVVTGRVDVRQRIKIFAERGNDAFPLSELQAAVLLPQLDSLAAQNTQRRAAVDQLLDATAPLTALQPVAIQPDQQPSFYKLAWRYAPPDSAVSREHFIAAVQAEGIALDHGFRGFARRSTRRCRSVGPLTYAARAAEQTVLLHHPVLLFPEQIAQIARGLTRVVNALSAGHSE